MVQSPQAERRDRLSHGNCVGCLSTAGGTQQRAKLDWVQCMHDLVYLHFPHAERCVIVEEQLNTHTPASLYEVFEPGEAKRILDRLEFHFTPKHGSWLNMAEIEFSVLGRQCLNGYIPDPVTF